MEQKDLDLLNLVSSRPVKPMCELLEEGCTYHILKFNEHPYSKYDGYDITVKKIKPEVEDEELIVYMPPKFAAQYLQRNYKDGESVFIYQGKPKDGDLELYEGELRAHAGASTE